MPRFETTREERAGRAVLRLAGAIDGGALRELKRLLDEERLPVCLDFSRVTDCPDYAVAVLSQALLPRAGVVLLGLRRHTQRMFGYFGVDPTDGPPGLPLQRSLASEREAG